MALRPQRTAQRFLISTTSRFVGEFEGPDILVQLAWPNFAAPNAFAKWNEGPWSRTAFVLAFEAPAEGEDGKPEFHDYSGFANQFCAYLAVLFGKRFDMHGSLQQCGLFHVPELAQYGVSCDPALPQNSHACRVDFQIPLELSEIGRLSPLLTGLEGIAADAFRIFQVATKFYWQAVQNAERDPEVAYLHLITSGEILSNAFTLEKAQLFDAETSAALQQIKSGLPDGDRIANLLSGRLLLLKKRFVKSIVDVVNEDFFEHSESTAAYGAFRPETFQAAISAAYDLRSKYVHTGAPFAPWVMLRLPGVIELPVGPPCVQDKEMAKILGKAPTYVGLERVIRYCLYRFFLQLVEQKGREANA